MTSPVVFTATCRNCGSEWSARKLDPRHVACAACGASIIDEWKAYGLIAKPSIFRHLPESFVDHLRVNGWDDGDCADLEDALVASQHIIVNNTPYPLENS